MRSQAGLSKRVPTKCNSKMVGCSAVAADAPGVCVDSFVKVDAVAVTYMTQIGVCLFQNYNSK